jgi:hypothetical protein
VYICCPNCHDENIVERRSKKNGHTYHGKQNHRCSCCSRQFVLGNAHIKPEGLRLLVNNALKERVLLRGTCRISLADKKKSISDDMLSQNFE